MKRVLLFCFITCLSFTISAQDFASRFLEKHASDTNLTCISISPKMMEEVLKIDADGDNKMMDMISKLKSMQMLKAGINSQKYYKEALSLLNKNSGRFESFLSFDDKSENCQILVRKKKGRILELVMLICEANSFVVINFTGNMNDDFITKLANSIEFKHS